MSAFTAEQIAADWRSFMHDQTRTPGSTLRFQVAHARVMAMVPPGAAEGDEVVVTEVCPACEGEHTVENESAQTVAYCKVCNEGGDADEPGIVTRRTTVGVLREAIDECVSSLEGIQSVEAVRS